MSLIKLAVVVFHVIKVVLDWKVVYILLIMENITGMLHLKKKQESKTPFNAV